ncbi:uncharacterized protein CLUP02_06305 [Colletotrichum lupini]|uniref:Uncharacterized protein n=1 Tax=Colletotrichum lupini TaxID=145971 RepID=A0A9Q8SP61_9PEZI|nr:uncharacterized protein CLUP02_06305 [Colletotrichum lupini]UQC80820.1 hypothetical protein CLUP02_06305 [Colletotrichum lupini]
MCHLCTFNIPRRACVELSIHEPLRGVELAGAVMQSAMKGDRSIAMPLEKQLGAALKCLSTGTPYFQVGFIFVWWSFLHMLTRKAVSSDSEREIMSSQLTDSLGSKAAGKVLAEIDRASKTSEPKKPFSISKGPFGVFKCLKRREVSLSQLSLSPITSEHDISLLVDPEDESFQTGTDPREDFGIDWSENELEGSMQLSLDCLDLLVAQSDSITASDPFLALMPGLQSDFSVNVLLMSWPGDGEGNTCGKDRDIIAPVTNAIETDNHLATSHANVATIMTIPPTLLCLGASISRTEVPEQAQTLLRYYKSHVGSTKISGQGKFKSTWQLLFLPCAFETFAELLVLNEAGQTFWVATRSIERARMHLKNAVKVEVYDSGLGGYKDLLMALIAMAMGSLCYGSRDLRVFLLDAERLIRVKGLSSHNSEIVRVLHHTYTYMRVIAEATYPFLDSESESDRISLLGVEVISGMQIYTLSYKTIQLSNEKDHLETRARSNPKLAIDLKTNTICGRQIAAHR